MKTCPDCAESIQDAARKCRYCGYRFDEEAAAAEARDPEPAATAAAPRKKAKSKARTGSEINRVPASSAPAASAPAAAAPAAGTPVAAATATHVGMGPHLTLAIGGVLIALSTVVMTISALSGSSSTALAGTGVVGVGLSGLVIAIGWGILVPRGKGSVAAAIASLAMPVTAVIAMMMTAELRGLSLSPRAAQAEVGFLGLVFILGPLVTMAVHYASLESLVEYVFARLGAAIAAIGLGYQVFSSTMKVELPGFLGVIASILAVGGGVLFGAGLTIGAVFAAKE